MPTRGWRRRQRTRFLSEIGFKSVSDVLRGQHKPPSWAGRYVVKKTKLIIGPHGKLVGSVPVLKKRGKGAGRAKAGTRQRGAKGKPRGIGTTRAYRKVKEKRKR